VVSVEPFQHEVAVVVEPDWIATALAVDLHMPVCLGPDGNGQEFKRRGDPEPISKSYLKRKSWSL